MMIFFLVPTLYAHDPFVDPFRQLEEVLPTPNAQRSATGHPGPQYWQQQADYDISVHLDAKKRTITGQETITYHNNSPESLPYLWLQLDQNYLAAESNREKIRSAPHMATIDTDELAHWIERDTYDGDIRITRVEDMQGNKLPHRIVGTMMRVDIPKPLQSQDTLQFSIDWNYRINDATKINARTGYESLPKTNVDIFEIAQWFPRMASYTDVHGWHHKQYIGQGEFTLDFGNYDVAITVPDNHIVAATGVLQNSDDILSPMQLKRWTEAQTASTPQLIVSMAEAQKNAGQKSKKTKTWRFHADNVRDFAFASSSSFLWDAWGRDINGQTVMAMSFYPPEAEPLWSQYSTHAVAHTLDVYSRVLFPYPYPVAISVNGPIRGMEYPMISFNGPRPLEDGTYIDKAGDGHRWINSKYGLISVIIHEVGHNWFPMIINSDERSWTWMDEGLNTFVQHIALLEWEKDFPNHRGEPDAILDYMKSDNQVPIMTNSESLVQFGSNAYAKPATALYVLRNTVLGPEMFDDAFQKYVEAWKFKRPMPADFFRIMEDASGTDLDWFWQTWFYSTAHIDIGIRSLRRIRLVDPSPQAKNAEKKRKDEEKIIAPMRKTSQNKGGFYSDRHKDDLSDFYSTYDQYEVTEADIEAYDELLAKHSPEEAQLFAYEKNLTIIELENLGEGISPVVVKLYFADNTNEEIRLPAEIWRHNSKRFSQLLRTEKQIIAAEIDPHHELADTDTSNNRYPPMIEEDAGMMQFVSEPPKNPMQKNEKSDPEKSLHDEK